MDQLKLSGFTDEETERINVVIIGTHEKSILNIESLKRAMIAVCNFGTSATDAANALQTLTVLMPVESESMINYESWKKEEIRTSNIRSIITINEIKLFHSITCRSTIKTVYVKTLFYRQCDMQLKTFSNLRF